MTKADLHQYTHKNLSRQSLIVIFQNHLYLFIFHSCFSHSNYNSILYILFKPINHNMASDQPSWKQIVATIEKVNLQQTLSIKLRERLINRKCIEDAKKQIEHKRQQASRKKFQESQQRAKMQQESHQQYQKRRKMKQTQMIKEKEYCSNNINLLKIKQTSQKDNDFVHQHPFIRLVDEQDKRLMNFRDNLRRQNEINFLQQKIKINENNEAKVRELENSKRYTNHINEYYDKKIRDRQQFRNKYLRLGNNSNISPENSPKAVDKQYQSVNEMLMRLKKQQINLEDRYLDNTLSKINKQINISDSSPAYLGRIPLSSDREKQLQYLEKSVFKDQQLESHIKRMKTEGDSPIKQQNKRRYTTQMNEMANLEKYYERSSHRTINKYPDINNSHSHLHSIDKKPCSLPSVHNSPIINVRNQQMIAKDSFQASDHPQRYRKRQQNHAQQHKRRVLSTFDIILNKKKLIVI